MVNFLKELEKFETDEERLKYLEKYIKKIKDKNLKKEIKGLIEELKRKIINKDLFRDITRKEAFKEFESFEEEIKYEPRRNLERDVGETPVTERREREEEPVKYELEKPVDQYRSYEIESPFLKLVEEFPELPKDRHIDIRGRVGDESIESILKGIRGTYTEEGVTRSVKGNIKYLSLEEYKGSADIDGDLRKKKKRFVEEYVIKQDGMV